MRRCDGYDSESLKSYHDRFKIIFQFDQKLRITFTMEKGPDFSSCPFSIKIQMFVFIYSTVTLLAKFFGLSTSQPRATAK